MINKKYKITNIQHPYDPKLFRIQALMDIPRRGVKAGDFGGFVESEDNLSQSGDCWIGDDGQAADQSRVDDNARVCGSASVFGDARVYGEALIHGNSIISDRVWVDGSAKVYGNALVTDTATLKDNVHVFGNAKVCGNTSMYDNVHVFGNAKVCGNTSMYDNVHVFGNAKVWSVMLKGLVRVGGDIKMNSCLCGGNYWYGEPPPDETGKTPEWSSNVHDALSSYNTLGPVGVSYREGLASFHTPPGAKDVLRALLVPESRVVSRAGDVVSVRIPDVIAIWKNRSQILPPSV